MNCASITLEEYPLVADVDGDGSSEICVTCAADDNSSQGSFEAGRNGQVRIFEADGGEIWQPTRQVWNQHGYFNVNVNDDLTIPNVQQDPSTIFSTNVCTGGPNRKLNTFLAQSPYLNSQGCPSFSAINLKLVDIAMDKTYTCMANEFMVTVALVNLGDLPINAQVPITFYNGDPALSTSSKLNTVKVNFSGYRIGETMKVSVPVDGPGQEFTLYASVNDNGTIEPPISSIPDELRECYRRDNQGFLTVTPGNFEISHALVSENIVCDGTSAGAGRAQVFYFDEAKRNAGFLWEETFQSLDLKDKEDSGETAWNFTRRPSEAHRLETSLVGGKTVIVFDGTREEAIWETEEIDISGLKEVKVSLSIGSGGGMEADSDYFKSFYALDRGGEVELTGGDHKGSFGSTRAYAAKISGNTIKLKVRAKNDSNDERYFIEEARVEGVRTVGASGDLEFFWFRENNFSDTLFTGWEYSALKEGVYHVVAQKDGQCQSNPELVEIRTVSEGDDLIRSDKADPSNFEKCIDGQLTLKTLGSFSSYHWEAKSGNEEYLSLGSSAHQTITEPSMVRVRVQGENGCSVISGSVMVTEIDVSGPGIMALEPNQVVEHPSLGKIINPKDGREFADLILDPIASNIIWSPNELIAEYSVVTDHNVSTISLQPGQSIRARWINESGCLQSDSVTYIKVSQEVETISVYPNPNNIGVLFVQLDIESGHIDLMDNRGKVLLSKELNGSIFQVDVRGLEDGIYILQIRNDQGQISRKRVVIRN